MGSLMNLYICNHCAEQDSFLVPIPWYLLLFILFLKINLFIIYFYFWLHWVFVAVHGLSLVAASGGYSLRRFLLLRSTGSRRTGFSSCGSRALERGLSSCGARA